MCEGGESRAGPGNAVKGMESEEKSEGTLSSFCKIMGHTSCISWMVGTASECHSGQQTKLSPRPASPKTGHSPGGKDQGRPLGCPGQRLSVRAPRDAAKLGHPCRETPTEARMFIHLWTIESTNMQCLIRQEVTRNCSGVPIWQSTLDAWSAVMLCGGHQSHRCHKG